MNKKTRLIITYNVLYITWYRYYRKLVFFPRTVRDFNELLLEATPPQSLTLEPQNPKFKT